jgi:hypothetical protein
LLDCHRFSTAGKQVCTRVSVRGFQVIINSLARGLRQLKLDGPAGLLLSDSRSIGGIATRRHIVDFEGYKIAASQLLSIARLNSARSLTQPSTWSLVRIDQRCLGRRGGFAPITVPLFHGTRFETASVVFEPSVMATSSVGEAGHFQAFRPIKSESAQTIADAISFIWSHWMALLTRNGH